MGATVIERAFRETFDTCDLAGVVVFSEIFCVD